MGKLSAAEQIAAKLVGKSEKVASKAAGLSKSEAEKILSKFDNVEAATALRGPERQAYLDALDVVYGDRAKRAKDLGFGDKVMYHGSPNDFSEFNVGPAANKNNEIPFGAHFTEDTDLASQFADNKKTGENVGSVYPVRLKKENTLDARPGIYREGTPEFEKFNQIAEKAKLKDYILKSNSEYNGFVGQAVDPTDILNRLDTKTKQKVLKDIDSIDYNATYREGPLGSGTPIHDPSTVITKSENIRSTNAAFDPRFKDSPNILALAGNQAPKIAAKMLKPQFSLGQAFSDITEPIDNLDAPVNNLIDKGAEKFGQLTDLTGGKDKDHQARASTAFNIAASMVAPTPSNVMLGGAGKVLQLGKGLKGAQIAEQMVKPKTAAELYREAKAASGSKFGTVTVKDTAPVKNFGTVTVKP